MRVEKRIELLVKPIQFERVDNITQFDNTEIGHKPREQTYCVVALGMHYLLSIIVYTYGISKSVAGTR